MFSNSLSADAYVIAQFIRLLVRYLRSNCSRFFIDILTHVHYSVTLLYPAAASLHCGVIDPLLTRIFNTLEPNPFKIIEYLNGKKIKML